MEAYKTLVGDGVAVLFQRAWPATIADPHLLEQAVTAFQTSYAKQWNNRSKPYDGIEILLNRLQAGAMTLGVLSNKPDQFTKQCIDHFFANIQFSSVAGQKPDVPRKPNPAGVFQMAAEWKLRTKKSLISVIRIPTWKLRLQRAVVRLEFRGDFAPSKNFVALEPNRSSRQLPSWGTSC